MEKAPKKPTLKNHKPILAKKWQKTCCAVGLMTIWVFCSVVASQLLLGFLMVWLLGAETLSQPIWSGVYSVLSYTLALVLIVFVPPRIKAKWQTSREQLGLNGTPTWTDIGLAPVGFIVGTVFAIVLAWVFSFFPWFNAEEVQDVGFSIYMNGGEKILAFLVLVVLAPVREELIFRGWLYGRLRARLNMPVAIIITSLLFAIMHFQWNVGVNVFALSVVLCGLREITGTIYAGILTHMIKNGVAFYLLYVLGIG